MAQYEIWHNPRCRKSREGLAILDQAGVDALVVKYLLTPPSADRIGEVLDMLDLEPRELMRKKESPYKELGLGDPARSRAELIKAMAENPILIERPVVIRGNRAVLGRPPENIQEFLKSSA